MSSEAPAWDWIAVLRFCERHAKRVTPRGIDPQDVAQEAALRAWRMRHQCQDPSRPWPWLARICQREAARLAARRGTAHLAPDHEIPAASHELETVERLAVHAAVAGLPGLDRTLISMRYGQDQTTERIARSLGIPEGTVKVRLHRARKRLRDALGEDDRRDH